MKIGLGKRLILLNSCIFIVFCLVVMATNIAYVWIKEKKDFDSEINKSADFIASSNLNFRDFDDANVKKFLESFSSEKSLASIILEVNGENPSSPLPQFYDLKSGTIFDENLASIESIQPEKNTFTQHLERNIVYQNMTVGKVHLYFSDKFIIDKVIDEIKIYLMILVAFGILFLLSIYFTLKNQLLTPIEKIHQLALSVSGFTSYLSESMSQERWSLVQKLLLREKENQARIEREIRDDELGDFMQAFLLVLNSFEVIVSELAQYSAQLQTLNEELEERINARTAELEDSNNKIFESLKMLKQTQAQLIQQEKMASIGQLAAGVAHEINNPIGYVGSNINRLDEYFNDIRLILSELEKMLVSLPQETVENVTAHINKIKKQIDYDFLIADFGAVISDCREGINRVKEIVQSLKDFSHNVDEKEFSEICINGAIQSALKVVNNEIKYCCDVKLELNLQEKITANLGQIHQVISNLLVNASHAMKEKPSRGLLTIRTYQTEDAAYIEVQDTGNGIPEEIRKKVFDPFFTTKPIGQGTGLGLNICYDIIVNKHKGNLSFESEMGIGTVFKVTLPIHN